MAKVTVNYSVSTWEGGDNYSSEFTDEAKALEFVARQLKNNKWGSPHVNEIIIHKEPVPELTLDEIAALMEKHNVASEILAEVEGQGRNGAAHVDGHFFILADVKNARSNGADQHAVIQFRDKFYRVSSTNFVWDYKNVAVVKPRPRTIHEWF